MPTASRGRQRGTCRSTTRRLTGNQRGSGSGLPPKRDKSTLLRWFIRGPLAAGVDRQTNPGEYQVLAPLRIEVVRICSLRSAGDRMCGPVRRLGGGPSTGDQVTTNTWYLSL